MIYLKKNALNLLLLSYKYDYFVILEVGKKSEQIIYGYNKHIMRQV